MQGKHLARLASVTAILKSDIAPRDVLLTGSGGLMTATYSGAYIRATVRVAADGEIGECYVGSVQLTGMAGLFDAEAPIEMKPSTDAIRIKSSDRSVSLRRAGQGQAVPTPNATAPQVTVSRAALQEEIALASAFVLKTPAMMSQAVLKGIRLRGKGTTLTVSAFDGRGLYIGAIPAKFIDDKTAIDITLPPNELGLALSVITSDELAIETQANDRGVISKVVFGSEDASVFMALIGGDWPALATFMAPNPGVTISLDAEKVSTVLQAQKALGAEDTLLINATNGVVAASTIENEAGVFTIAVGEQPVDAPSVRTAIGSETTRQAVRIGSPIELRIPEKATHPLVLSSGKRRVWLPAKVIATPVDDRELVGV